MFPFLPIRRTVPMPVPRVLCEPLAIRLQLPPRCLVLHRAVIMLKTRVALLARVLLPAVLIEARNRKPGPVCRCLASLGVEPVGRGEDVGELGAVDLQITVANAAPIHPLAQALGTRMNCTVLMASSIAACWAWFVLSL